MRHGVTILCTIEAEKVFFRQITLISNALSRTHANNPTLLPIHRVVPRASLAPMAVPHISTGAGKPRLFTAVSICCSSDEGDCK